LFFQQLGISILYEKKILSAGTSAFLSTEPKISSEKTIPNFIESEYFNKNVKVAQFRQQGLLSSTGTKYRHWAK